MGRAVVGGSYCASEEIMVKGAVFIAGSRVMNCWEKALWESITFVCSRQVLESAILILIRESKSLIVYYIKFQVHSNGHCFDKVKSLKP